jgi:cellulose synthase/poly-beta-1,6-N-acetylglucosamine synthase-like glycosyltransferase
MTDPWRDPWSIGVIIPACNEEDTIEACIASVLDALNTARIERYWIVVVADDCGDRTVERAERAVGGAGEVVTVTLNSAGAARRAGVARVLLQMADVDPSRLWLANTDADTTVSESWIRVQLALADDGVTGVAGIVQLATSGCAAAHEVYRRTYLTNPEGTHSHVHGANLSVRADAYEDAGGWSELALAEDHCLWTRLRSRGWRLLSSVSSIVTTSARLEGRAKGGFADTLRACVEAVSVET